MKKIAIIPARSGSKGLKDKNIIDLCGKPMIAYSIEAAEKTKLFEQVIVSTDSKIYAGIAKQYGADVIMRSEALSDDKATTFMVIEDLLHRLAYSIDYFVLLQPTSPLRNNKHIEEAVMLFEPEMVNYDFLVSMKRAEHTSALVKPIENNLDLRNFSEDFADYRRQSYIEYSPNGAIFIGKPDAYLEKKHFFGARSLAYIMEKRDSFDVDDELDYHLVQYIMHYMLNGKEDFL